MTPTQLVSGSERVAELKQILVQRDNGQFSSKLQIATRLAQGFNEVLPLITLRRKANAAGIVPDLQQTIRVAVVGGSSLVPLTDLITHFLMTEGFGCELWAGDFDNYVSEIMDAASDLYSFRPDVVFIIPSERSCKYQGRLSDSLTEQQRQADAYVAGLLQLLETVNQRTGAEVVVANFRLSPYYDPGPLRYKSLGSDYNFRKYVGLQLGLKLPPYAQLCDVEFLASRRGTLLCHDDRTWFESKQPYAADLQVDVAREFSHIVRNLRTTPKKVIVLDLDNTVWGGVVGDDGLEGIEIGTTSPRGEAFRAFQQYLLSLTERGVLLAVCSKNDHAKAVEPFERHPEMVLRLKDISNFKANWEPKSENIRAIASELNLGLDSLVFVDDNPAEIEIVRQFVPQVTTIHVGEDPSEFIGKLKDSRLFEFRSLTSEDVERVGLYRKEAERQQLLSTSTDMASYLESLGMEAEISEFLPIDVPRIAQLINKSNQFNLTTRRRTEAEVQALMNNPDYATFTIRLSDKFGDHGLIATVIGRVAGSDFEIDTWLMSCRVLKRQVEELTLNTIFESARSNGCERVVGVYIPTAKNEMVKELYPSMGFRPLDKLGENSRFEFPLADFTARETKISIMERVHATSSGN